MGKKQRPYKRSWKNLLLNKSYQLRFTMIMVGLSVVLMSLLGWWVMTVADRATQVAIHNVMSNTVPCTEPMPPGTTEPAPVDTEIDGDEQPGVEGGAVDDEERRRRSVVVETGPMKFVEGEGGNGKAAGAGSADLARAAEERYRKQLAQYEECVANLKLQTLPLEERNDLIRWVLLGVGLLLAVGLFGYGIKMTHRVAGPLFKVGLYLDKLRDNRYDTVYNLRKGDHLVEFYEHFKAAHAGLSAMQKEDIERLRAILEVAEAKNLAEKSEEIASALAALKSILEEKEASIAEQG